MSSSSARPAGSSQFGVASHVDAFLIDTLAQTADLKKQEATNAKIADRCTIPAN